MENLICIMLHWRYSNKAYLQDVFAADTIEAGRVWKVFGLILGMN